MKKILLLVSLTLIVVSCNQLGEKEYLITGTAEGVENGKTIILEKIAESGMGFEPIDTVVVKDGKFEIKGNIEETAIHLLQVESKDGKIPFILEHGEITVTVDKDSIQNSKIGGTLNNTTYQDFIGKMKGIEKETQKKQFDFQSKNMQVMNDAQEQKDTATMMRLSEEYQNIGKSAITEYIKFAEANPKAFISALIIEGMTKQPDADVEKIKKIYGTFTEDVKNSKPGKGVKTFLDGLNKVGMTSTPEVGNEAPNFSAPNPDGKMVSLKESLGKVTIIDFWASWCGPCRKENPNVVALYDEFHTKGLNIIGVSLDKEGKSEEWKKAITNDKLAWTHVSNLKFWSDPIAQQYGVQSIPATFILDETGKIVAKDLRGDALKAKVKSLLGVI